MLALLPPIIRIQDVLGFFNKYTRMGPELHTQQHAWDQNYTQQQHAWDQNYTQQQHAWDQNYTHTQHAELTMAQQQPGREQPPGSMEGMEVFHFPPTEGSLSERVVLRRKIQSSEGRSGPVPH